MDKNKESLDYLVNIFRPKLIFLVFLLALSCLVFITEYRELFEQENLKLIGVLQYVVVLVLGVLLIVPILMKFIIEELSYSISELIDFNNYIKSKRSKDKVKD